MAFDLRARQVDAARERLASSPSEPALPLFPGRQYDEEPAAPPSPSPREQFRQGRVMARALGWMYVVGPVLSFISIALALLPYAHVGGLLVVDAAAIAIGVVLLSGRLDTQPSRVFEAIVAAGTVAVSLAVYFAGSPSAGFRDFYLWVIPYAWRFFSRRAAVAHTAFAAIASGFVLVIQVHQQGGPLSRYYSLWLISVVTMFIIGVLVERLTASLHRADERFQRGFWESPIGLVLLDPQMRILEMNPAFSAILERSPQELVGVDLADHTYEEDRARSQHMYQTALAQRSPVSFQERYVRADGVVRTVSVHAHSQRGEAYVGTYLFCQMQDVSEERLAQEALAYKAVHDPLTGLFNRTLFLGRLDGALSDPRCANGHVAAMVIDLDQFKLINDSFGHSHGDDLLVTLADRLKRIVRPSDTLARLGGDEFVLLIEQWTEPAEVMAVADRFRAAINEPVNTPNGVFVLSASIGIALAEGSTTAECLLRDADAAMYTAKAKGRGRIAVFDDTMRLAVTERLALETELRQAIINEEFVLHYQPIIDTRTGLAHTLEALVRWEHPTRGLVMPVDFIPVAEDNGSIVDIGQLVLELASSDLARWQRDPAIAGPLRVCVNVSARQLHDDKLIEHVANALTVHEIERGTLAIEVTESALLDESMAPSRTLQQIRELGVPIVLDDFGTGYSSLGYIQRFPIDGLKLDRSFVEKLGVDGTSAAIVDAVLTMSGALGLYVVAEGVETEDQIETLTSLGCHYLQGYAFARPMPADAVMRYLAAQGMHAL